MKTKLKDFDKDRYKAIRNAILGFSSEWTHNRSFSNYMENDYSYEDIENIENRLNNQFNYTLAEFFNTYRDKIYKDDKLIHCGGFVDLLLYKFDKSYLLGGDKKFGDDYFSWSSIFITTFRLINGFL